MPGLFYRPPQPQQRRPSATGLTTNDNVVVTPDVAVLTLSTFEPTVSSSRSSSGALASEYGRWVA